jgi:hypothetical protein
VYYRARRDLLQVLATSVYARAGDGWCSVFCQQTEV